MVFYVFICNFAPVNKNYYARNQQILWNHRECSISVLDRVVDGKAPSKVIAKVNEWMNLHEAEILTMWEKAQKGEKIGRIEPLK